MGMTLKELLTKGEGTLSAQEAKTLASQCRMDVETLYTLLEERGIKVLDNEAEEDASLDVDSILAEVENAEANSDELGLGVDEEEEAEENPADLKAAMDELLDDPVKNYLKQIGQIPLLSAEQEVEGSRRIHAGAEAAHILQADRIKYGAPEYIKKNSARFSFEEDENSRSYNEDLDDEGGEKSTEDAEEKAAEEKAEEEIENGPLTEERRQELLKTRRDGLNARRSLSEANLRLVVSIAKKHRQERSPGFRNTLRAVRYFRTSRGGDIFCLYSGRTPLHGAEIPRPHRPRRLLRRGYGHRLRGRRRSNGCRVQEARRRRVSLRLYFQAQRLDPRCIFAHSMTADKLRHSP